jgi:hypothetical protein
LAWSCQEANSPLTARRRTGGAPANPGSAVQDSVVPDLAVIAWTGLPRRDRRMTCRFRLRRTQRSP